MNTTINGDKVCARVCMGGLTTLKYPSYAPVHFNSQNSNFSAKLLLKNDLDLLII